ncbi:MYND-type domain-containing protein [Mycena chlorophos]|uniref:MYND-type domain-containing protein n=1 Tax=Mycena chlorophos TaxID=658473 RepID=A0A8H6VVT5_MYCCL|nr:MYND-type domain-containing protein [Mycena chlorophos]
MHSTLHVSNLKKLPAALKRLADNALESRSGAGTARRLIVLVRETLRNDVALLPLLLPVARILLDRNAIEALLRDTEGGSVFSGPVLDGVGTALGAIHFLSVLVREEIQLAPDAFQHLWELVCAWAEFLPSIADYFPSETSTEIFAAIITGLDSMRRYAHEHSECRDTVLSPPAGLYTVLGITWHHLLSNTDTYAALQHMSSYLFLETDAAAHHGLDSDKFLSGLALGTGGTWRSLGRTFLEHIVYVILEPSFPLDNKSCLQVLGVVVWLERIANGNTPGQRELREALLRDGVVEISVTACQILCQENRRMSFDTVETMRMDFASLILYYTWGPRHQIAVAEALRAGLLRVYLDSSKTIAKQPTVVEKLQSILEVVLPNSLSFGSVLHALRTSLEDVKDINHAKNLPTAKFTAGWERFLAAARHHLKILEQYEQGTLTKYRACDNNSCSAVVEKYLLRRCAGCRSTFYCSKTCQKEDYRQGHHRADCALFQQRREELCAAMKPRDRAFLRALANFAHETMKSGLAFHIFTNMHAPIEMPVYTAYDFADGNPRQAFYSIIPPGPMKDAVLDHPHMLHLERVKDWDSMNDPRRNVTFLAIPSFLRELGKQEKRWIVFALRSSTTEMHDTLRAFAERTPIADPSQAERYRGQVEALVKKMTVRQTH